MSQGYSVAKESESDVAPLILPSYQPVPRPPQQGMSSNSTNVVEIQPMGEQLYSPQVVPRPQANDHLWLTIVLAFLCIVLGCNWVGVLCLMPGLICAAVGADYNKEGSVSSARSCGTMAFIYDMIIVVIHIGAYVIGFISTIVAIGVIFSQVHHDGTIYED